MKLMRSISVFACAVLLALVARHVSHSVQDAPCAHHEAVHAHANCDHSHGSTHATRDVHYEQDDESVAHASCHDGCHDGCLCHHSDDAPTTIIAIAPERHRVDERVVVFDAPTPLFMKKPAVRPRCAYGLGPPLLEGPPEHVVRLRTVVMTT